MKVPRNLYPLPRRQSVDGKRSFACFPAAVLVFVVNELQEFLLLRHPNRSDWEVINGALEDGETVLEGALRETYEEGGPNLRVKPIGTVHVSSFHYDEQAPFMISIGYVASYIGGPVEPGDDMTGSDWAWASLQKIHTGEFSVLVPPGQLWLFTRAVEVFSLWKDRQDLLQLDLSEPTRNKYQDKNL